MQLADYDSLTGVLGSRRFLEELGHHVTQARRYGTEGALLFLDLDDFKSINDGLGHRAGDNVLSEVAALLRGRLRESDLLGRLGGDEFAVLLLRADRDQAQAVAGTAAGRDSHSRDEGRGQAGPHDGQHRHRAASRARFGRGGSAGLGR